MIVAGIEEVRLSSGKLLPLNEAGEVIHRRHLIRLDNEGEGGSTLIYDCELRISD